MLRFLTAGESHGPSEVAILEGLPAGLTITKDDIQHDLDKRKGGYGRGGRGKIESDEVEILSGIRLGKTLGSPIALVVKNNDYENWKERMSPTPSASRRTTLGMLRETKPRPGHADLSGALKYQTDDVRNILERASARETIMRVALGAVCRKFLLEFGIEIASHTIRIGSVRIDLSHLGDLGSLSNLKYFEKIKRVYQTDPDIRCIDPHVSEQMKEHIRQTTIKKDTLGGVIEIIAHNVPVGLGSHVHWDRKLDGRISQALMSIPSVKGVEIGEAIKASGSFGSEVQDEIYYRSGSDPDQGRTLSKGFYRKTNRLGGIEGGISNGEDIVCRVYHKPISTLASPLQTVDITTKEPTSALIERSDVCVVPRAGIISESMLAYVLADSMLEKFGGDSLEEIKRNFESYKKWIASH